MGVTPQPFDYRHAYLELLQRVRALESGNPLNSGSIDSGGLVAGTTDDGQPILELGEQVFGGVGIIIRRQNGAMAFTVGKGTAGDPNQSVKILDKGSNVILGDSFLSIHGADRPSIGYTMQRVDTSGDVTTTSTAFVDLFEVHFRTFNGFIEGRFQARCAAAATAGEVRLADQSGNPLAIFLDSQTPVAVPAGTTTFTRYTTQGCSPPGGPPTHTPVTVRVQGRVTTTDGGSLIVRPGIVCGY